MSELKVGDLVYVKMFSASPSLAGEICKVEKFSEDGERCFVNHPYRNYLEQVPVKDVDRLDPLAPYRDALFAVDPGACNLSGLSLSLARHNKLIWYEVRKNGGDFNTHPAVVLFVSQMAQLSRCEHTEAFSRAYEACKAKVAESEGK